MPKMITVFFLFKRVEFKIKENVTFVSNHFLERKKP